MGQGATRLLRSVEVLLREYEPKRKAAHGSEVSTLIAHFCSEEPAHVADVDDKEFPVKITP